MTSNPKYITEKLLLSLIDQLQDAIFAIKDGKMIFFNKPLKDLFGYSRKELLSRQVSEFVHEDDRATVTEHYQAVVNGEKTSQVYTFRIITGKGEVRHLNIRAGIVHADDGSIIYLGSLIDLTQSENTIRDLANSKADIESILTNIPDVFYRTDMNGIVLYMSISIKETLGYHPEEMVGKPLADFYCSPGDREKIVQALIDGNGNARQVEACLRKKDGSKVWISTNAYIRLDEEKQPVGIEGVARNITERKDNIEALRESEDRFKALTEASYGGIGIHDKGHILECNQGLSDITGFSYQELIGMNGLELIAPDSLDTVLDHIKSGYEKSYDVNGVRKDGSVYSLAIKGKNITYKGVDARVIEFRDITENKQAEDDLKLAASVFSQAKEGITITDTNACILNVNDAFTDITGYEAGEVLGKNPRILKSNRQPLKFYQKMWESLEEEGYWQGEVWNCRKNGEVYPSSLSLTCVYDPNGKVINYIGFFTDITRVKAHQDQLERMAHYDVLTNLPNRVLLRDRLEHALTQSQRRIKSLAVVFLDIDGFKEINDTHGHNIGDELLVILSQRIKGALREEDTLSRLGGDEFIAVLADLEKVKDCEPVLNRILQAAAEPVLIDNKVLNVSASLGVTIYPQDASDADQLIRHADQAMYKSKQMGKNCYHFFDTAQYDDIKVHLESINNIKLALNNHEFTLYYQPKINMATGAIVGAEALIRWLHPEHGLILPLKFLPVIENDILSIQLGEWVMGEALKQIAEWNAYGLDIPVSVNIGAFQLQQDTFAIRLSEILALHPDVAPHSLELEVLETSALSDVIKVSAIMNACIEQGVSFALDDFGTGYSSLTHLRRLPARIIKIDQTFVRDMLVDPDDLAIVEGVVGLAKTFKLDVIAEGVETVDHAVALQKIGCDLAQGYGIARPMPAKEVQQWAVKWKLDHGLLD